MKKCVMKTVLALCAIACFLPGTGSAQSGTREVLLWTFFNNAVDYWTGRSVELEEKFNIDLKIEVVPQNIFLQRLSECMAEGKNAPDIVEWMIEYNRILASDPQESLVIPLDTYVRRSAFVPYVPPGRLSWVTYGGHLYGLPVEAHPVVLVYNDTLWKKAGVDLESVVTWDEFFQAARQLTAKKENGKPLHHALPHDSWGGPRLTDTMWMIWQQTGSQIVTSDGRPNFTDPAFREFVRKWIAWEKTDVFADWDWGNFSALIANGTYASFVAPDWWVFQVNDAVDAGQYRFKARALPVYRRGGPRTSSWGGTFMAITRTAPHPERLYEVMEYMLYDRQGVLDRIQSNWGGFALIPAFRSVWDDPIFHQPDPRFGGQRLAELQTELAWDSPRIQVGDVFWDAVEVFNECFPEIRDGRLDLDEGLQKIQEETLGRMK